MTVSPLLPSVAATTGPGATQPSSAEQSTQVKDDLQETRKVFDQFVGETFYNQLLSAMRKTVGKPAYLHGGRGEEVFRGQMDQLMAERLSNATAETFTGPMFELFTMGRPGS